MKRSSLSLDLIHGFDQELVLEQQESIMARKTCSFTDQPSYDTPELSSARDHTIDTCELRLSAIHNVFVR